MRKELYYAVGGTGQGCIFSTKPERDEVRKIWVGDIVGCYMSVVMQMEFEGLQLPSLKWSDEPVKIKIEVCIER